ncbi:helix-turn-helix domain-containing protein [Nocardiopsis metallicus]|uniref:Transcriptional regulator with XRE-family HTH domain n=1 Tax=Nocardiopsis metallicus TaxID=179819 RepID=A0A840W967_9ACTN|nr:XRE family transcriptional regulator [Nocardiopsis metallicus]MBB5489601.1 transcriptional regulator with XRE-family HTH domain [Nocardiopsis metallicus]
MMDQLSWESIGERVRDSRASMGLSQQDLADRVGLERSMISKLEKGARRVDAMELTAIARVLDYPVTHFLSPTPEVVSRRAATTEAEELSESTAARGAYRNEAELAQWLRDVRQLIDLGTLTPRPLALYPHRVTDLDSARDAARWIRTRLGLGDAPIESVADVCESAGQFLAVAPLTSDGASLVDGDVAVAVIRLDQEPGRRRSTAAHELGHMVLGDEYSNDLGVHTPREERERAVEVFAAELLLPSGQLDQVLAAPDEESRRHALVRLAAEYRVSWSLAIAQLRRSGTLDGGELRKLRGRVPTEIEFREAVGWKPQPDLASIRVSPRYSSAVVAALREYAITPARAVEMMRGQIELRDLSED